MTTNRFTQTPLPFANDDLIAEIAREYGTPLFIHDEDSYRRYGQQALEATNAFGLTVRYAMKANSHRAVLRIFDDMGILIDASSRYEALRAIAAGIDAEKIQLTSQEVQTPDHLREMIDQCVRYNACSIEQLRLYADLFPGDKRPISIRVNPGLGSGHNNRTNTAGPAASFGIWRDYLPDALRIAQDSGLSLERLHTHVGSGSDWRIWQKAARMTLDVAREMPDVNTVSLGGGYKIDRIEPENSIDLQTAFQPVREAFEEFERDTGRQLHMEIEPGTYLACNSNILVARVDDIVDTGSEGYTFLKINASMTELLRPMIYGARHPIRLLGKGDEPSRDYVVAGMCCESGDLFTTEEGNPDGIGDVRLPEAQRGNFLAILGAGAYAISMSAKHYNSRPCCAEVMIAQDGSHRLITQREAPEDIWRRELD